MAKNISQAELADLIGVHSTHISRYERDLTQPTLDAVKRIGEALVVSVNALVYGPKDKKEKNTIKDQVLLTMFARVQGLDKQDVTCIKSMLNAYILKTDLQKQLS